MLPNLANHLPDLNSESTLWVSSTVPAAALITSEIHKYVFMPEHHFGQKPTFDVWLRPVS